MIKLQVSLISIFNDEGETAKNQFFPWDIYPISDMTDQCIFMKGDKDRQIMIDVSLVLRNQSYKIVTIVLNAIVLLRPNEKCVGRKRMMSKMRPIYLGEIKRHARK